MRRLGTAAFLALLGLRAGAATFTVPTDAELIRRAESIVVATALHSFSERNADGALETVTTFTVEESIKGPFRVDGSVRISEPGGAIGSLGLVIPGSPRFADGERVLLFLARLRNEKWTTLSLTLGRFTLTTDIEGRPVAVREEAEVVGWDSEGNVHRERRRSAPEFLEFVRAEVRGGASNLDYFMNAAPLIQPLPTAEGAIQAQSHLGTFAPSKYLIVQTLNGTTRAVRWPLPAGVKPFRNSSIQPGRTDGGLNGILAGLSAWTNDNPSIINYHYGGSTSTPQRLGGEIDDGMGNKLPDGVNGIEFEDPAAEVPATACNSGCILGQGGFWVNTGTSSLSGETFWNIIEGNVVLNDLLLSWSGLNTPKFDQLMAHELGHTMGLRHSNQNATGGACDPATMPCDTVAIMTSSLSSAFNGAFLQNWDKDAVRSVYPGADNFSFDSDFDGDNIDDRTIFRPSAGQWWILGTTAGLMVKGWGQAGDLPVAADYDGDGKTDLAIFRPSTGTWWIQFASGGATTAGWGEADDIPVPGDYDGDGKVDVAVWRPSTGFWWVRRSTFGLLVMGWGVNGDRPVQADYDGDGKTDLAVWRPSTGVWWVKTSGSNFSLATGNTWGMASDIPTPGTFDTDTKADMAVWRPGANQFWIRNSMTGSALVINWGAEGDLPVVGDYNGDLRSDYVVWRPSTGFWWTRFSSTGVAATGWGSNGDAPIHHVIGR